ncbi:hypothetical protein [Kibdelosporangium philippinense]|uniref:hypothetical protein n=1 Tax=Kibdelosporangium philippinense TaxID=211113 RepID=UPI00360BD5FF
MLGRLAYVNGDFRQQLRAWLADNLHGEFAKLRGVGGPGREHEQYESRRSGIANWRRRAGVALAGRLSMVAVVRAPRKGHLL